MENNQKPKSKNNQKKTKGETISELAHRHLLNRNHTTTDEEIRNARIEFNEADEASAEDLSYLSDADK